MKMVTLLTIYYCLTTLLAWQIGHPAGVLARVFFLACVGLNALNVQWQHHRCLLCMGSATDWPTLRGDFGLQTRIFYLRLVANL